MGGSLADSHFPDNACVFELNRIFLTQMKRKNGEILGTGYLVHKEETGFIMEFSLVCQSGVVDWNFHGRSPHACK